MIDQLCELVGRKVVAAHINETNTVIVLQLKDMFVYLVSTGDCCSNSWFEHVEGIDALIDKTILSVEEVDYVEVDDSNRECVKSYGFKFKTNHGTFFIEMRNESNGYYGGDIDLYSSGTLMHDYRSEYWTLKDF